ncbi:MAG: hypothetical protein K2P92_03050 [Bdellovibrionaceae bacterium]|nr:hypothetical protein [Pseudobdellovibrionaceae bacterium]
MKLSSKNFHESFERAAPLKVGSNKQFGYVFAGLFFILSISSYAIVPKIRMVLIVASILTLAITLLRPQLLTKPNRLWARFGELLGKIVSPLILGILFFVVFMPMALILKICRKDVLDLKIEKSKNTYWVKSPLQDSSMKDQF